MAFVGASTWHPGTWHLGLWPSPNKLSYVLPSATLMCFQKDLWSLIICMHMFKIIFLCPLSIPLLSVDSSSPSRAWLFHLVLPSGLRANHLVSLAHPFLFKSPLHLFNIGFNIRDTWGHLPWSSSCWSKDMILYFQTCQEERRGTLCSILDRKTCTALCEKFPNNDSSTWTGTVQ